MRIDGNYGSPLGYGPNSHDEWQKQPDVKEPSLELDGAADNWSHREDDNDHYSQPKDLFNLMNAEQKKYYLKIQQGPWVMRHVR